jgi:predicted transcriptional regulator
MPASPMSAKEKIVRLLDEQPADSSFEEILRELAFASMVERGLDEVDQGHTLSHEEVRREVESWES